MTKKKTTATHTKAKRKTTPEKPEERTAGSGGIGTKRILERKKKPAKATAQKPRRKSENRQPYVRVPVDALQSAETVDARLANHGLARLKEEARNIVEKDGKQMLKGLKERARRGSVNDVKLLVNLAGLNEEKPANDKDAEIRTALLRDWMTQPEYQERNEDSGNGGNAQPGDVETARAAAEKTIEATSELP